MNYVISSSHLSGEYYNPYHQRGLIRKPTSLGVLRVKLVTDLKDLNQYWAPGLASYLKEEEKEVKQFALGYAIVNS